MAVHLHLKARNLAFAKTGFQVPLPNDTDVTSLKAHLINLKLKT